MGRIYQQVAAIRQDIGRPVYWSLAALGFLLPLAGWFWASNSGIADPVFLPSPQAVWESAQRWWAEGFWQDLWVSIYRVMAGFLLAVILGVPLGVMIGSFKSAEAYFQPLNDFIRYMPASAFIPLTILWVGIGEGSKIAIIFIGVFFQIVVMTADTVRRIPHSYLEAASTLGADREELLSLVIWRGSQPQLLDILRVNMGWAWTYLVVAELVAANDGLGYAILTAQRFLETDRIFAGILVIGLIGLLFDFSFRWLQRRLFPWVR